MTTAAINTPSPTSLTLIDRIGDPIQAAVTLGKAIAESGMFGAQNIGQGVVIAFHCLQCGMPILQFQREFHLVDGKPSMKAEAMLAKFRERGGDYKWKDDGANGSAAELWVSFKGNEQTVRYTLDQAKIAGLVKPGSGWVKNPANMLRARVVSNAITMVCPEVKVGYYTPEEIEDIGTTSSEPASPPSEFAQPVSPTPRRGRPPKALTDSSTTNAVESPSAAAPLASSTPAESPANDSSPAPAQVTSSGPVEVAAIESPLEAARRLRTQADIDDAKWSAVLGKLGCPVDGAGKHDESKLSAQQLHHLSEWLSVQLQKKEQANTSKSLEQWANSTPGKK